MSLLAVGAAAATLLAACGSSSPGSTTTTTTASSGSSTTTTASSGSSTTASGGSTTTAAVKSSKNYHFELITKSNASPYWLAVKEGADAAAKKDGVTVTFEAPASGTDLSTQISMVNNAVTAHVDGIILAAQQPAPLVNPVKNAQSHGIPVITVDSGVQPNVSKSFLATSNVGAAAALAQVTAKLAGSKGEYAIIDFNEISSTGIERPQGFKQGMAKFPGFKFDGQQISNNIVSTGKAEAGALLQSHPNINLMFGANDRAALGVAEAVQAAHKVGKVIVAGFDADLGELPLIKGGVIEASVLQSPYQMGYQAVSEMIQVKQGKSVPKQVNTPYFILTPKNFGTAQATQFIKQYVPSYNG